MKEIIRTCNLTVRFSKFKLNIKIYEKFKGFLSKLFDCEDRSFIVLKKWALTPNKYTVTEAQKQKPHGMSHYIRKIKTCIHKLDGIVPSSGKTLASHVLNSVPPWTHLGVGRLALET